MRPIMTLKSLWVMASASQLQRVLAVSLLTATLLFLAGPHVVRAQYATGGSGQYRNNILWFSWGPANARVPQHGLTETNRYQVGTTILAVTCTLSNISSTDTSPSPDLRVYRPGDWHQDGLDDLYNIGGTGNANKLAIGVRNEEYGALVTFSLTCNATSNGQPIALSGLVFADAEANDSAEYIQFSLPSGSTFHVLEALRSAGCTRPYRFVVNGSGTYKTSTPSGSCSTGPMAVGFIQGATSGTFQVKGSGLSAIAVGVVLNGFDAGDAPIQYGEAWHFRQGTISGGTIPANSTQDIFAPGFSFATLQQAPLRLGATVDVDVANRSNVAANGDDLSGDDEDGVTMPAVGRIGQTHSIPVLVNGSNGILSAWFDWNRDGDWSDAGEQVVTDLAVSGTTNLNVSVPANASRGQSYARFRLSTTNGLGPTDFASDGEVEDYRLLIAAPAITIRNFTNGHDAQLPIGPEIIVGDPVTWTYAVSNIGNVTLTSVLVTDDKVGPISCPQTTLAPASSMTCTKVGTALTTGQYTNTATVVGSLPVGPPVTAKDPSHYFGVQPAFVLKKYTNGEDADTIPGPEVISNTEVIWSYIVTNTGDVPLTITVTDDQEVLVFCEEVVTPPGAANKCFGHGIATAGQYTNTATATATYLGKIITSTDLSHYLGITPTRAVPAITLRKFTNDTHSDETPGHFIRAGDPVTWTYIVNNTGNVSLTVTVSDLPAQLITCPKLVLEPADHMECEATGTAVAGPYENSATVEGLPPAGPPVTDTDSSHYFGVDTSIQIKKYTNGPESTQDDADTPPGPHINAGAFVTWTYVVTNTGNMTLTNVLVTDSQGVFVDCPLLDLNPGESMTCLGDPGIAELGPYTNTGFVAATALDGEIVSDSDVSHYIGQPSFIVQGAALAIKKYTEGEDAGIPPGPVILVGDTVHWSYVVTNTGSVSLTNVSVTDDQVETVTCPKTSLASAETMTCTAGEPAEAGQYTNTGIVVGTPLQGASTSASDVSHYFGAQPAFAFTKRTNIQSAGPGGNPPVDVGGEVDWYYEITNTGNVPLLDYSVVDHQEGPIACPQISPLMPGQVVVCTLTGVAVEGQYINNATAVVTPTAGAPLTLDDPSRYFGVISGIVIKKYTNGEDAGQPPGPQIAIGSPVTWTYVVTNTSNVTLTQIAVTDDKEGTITCPATSLAAGAGMTCTKTGFAVEGSYANTATVIAISPTDKEVTASDLSYYFGFVQMDFGDAPASYPVTIAQDGGHHAAGSLRLGNHVDTEVDGVPSANADGDDLQTSDDEDGVTLPAELIIAETSSVSVDVRGGKGFLSGWIDWNDDGDWLDAGEQIATAQAVNAGTTNLDVTVPANAVVGQSYARFRLSSSSSTSTPNGFGEEGEVEDYPITIVGLPELQASKRDVLFDDVDGSGNASPGDTLRYTVVITNRGTGEAVNVLYTDNIDANTTLVNGSVTTTQGTVTTGNGAGDSTVVAALGDLPVSDVVTIVYDVVIHNPLPTGVTQVSNQGIVTDGDPATPDVPTDDPDDPTGDDPTETPITAAPVVEVTKSDAHFDDADGSGTVSPGDTLLYTVIITNSGNIEATGVTYADSPDANTSLEVGSVTTSAGTVTDGNSVGDSTVGVNVGDLAGGGAQVTINYLVTINNPLPAGVTQVSNQGLVSATGVPDTPTDDPNDPAADDPTETPITAAPQLSASKSDALFDDADGSGAPSPGDTLVYNITLTNSGNQAATGEVYTDTPDANTTLVVGSVATDLGSVTTGNTAEDTSVSINIGNLPGGGAQVNVSYQVIINNPLSAGVTEISNQGLATSTDPSVPDAPTDDLDTPDEDDPTITPIASEPVLDATKVDSLLDDADGSGTPSPGDTLLYTVIITNSGNQAATGVGYADTPDTNTTLVVGSVATDLGTITEGNVVGDTQVSINVGTLPGGGATANISYRVTINNPLPAGVTAVSNQGIASSSDPRVPNTPTDDPNTPTGDDPTVTPVTAQPILDVTKRDTLLVDADSSGTASPGDTLAYVVTIVNSGKQAATGVVYADSPDSNTTLIVGSVATDLGSVSTGNTAGDTNVSVNIGTLTGGAAANIAYRVTINSPLPAGVTSVSNQGIATSSDPRIPSTPTDDPDDPTPDDPTETPISASPELSAIKRDTLLTDADGSGAPSPGDELLYTITIANGGNTAATGMVYADTPDANTSLVAGSVTTSVGTVTSGNNVGNTAVGVTVGDLAGSGAQVTISYRVTINNPLPTGVTAVANQGIVTVTNPDIPDIITDDPDDPTPDDPTETPVTAIPILQTFKLDNLWVDADGNGNPSPGDTLQYQVRILNTGNQNATAVSYGDLLDPNTALVVGTVATSAGTVDTGNHSGDTQIVVNVGTLAGQGGEVIITFSATIIGPLPAGVTQVSNQGIVTDNDPRTPDAPTDDPDDPAPDDPTDTPVIAAPAIDSFKRDSLLLDADGSGSVTPGDTLLLNVSILNSGNQAATGLVYTDNLDPYTTLVVGSVASSLGTITEGNTAGNTRVSIDIGTLDGGDTEATISYQVMVNNPLPAGVNSVSNQGVASSSDPRVPDTPTDDPDTLDGDDPTETSVTAMPQLDATKRDSLLVDVDGNGAPSPGDTLLFNVSIMNSGNQAATGVVYQDLLDPNVTMVTGSPNTDRGTITDGADETDTQVIIDIGTLPGGAAANISYRITINNPLPTGVTTVSNQGIVTSTDPRVPDTQTDDPDTTEGDDPTETPVTAMPVLDVTKSDSILVDADSNGSPSPGDTLLYNVTIINTGNQAAAGMVYADMPDVNTTLVAGSVATDLGLIAAGNAAGDTLVSINVGTLPGGNTAVNISYQVIINNPLPAGVSSVSNQGIASSTDPRVPSTPTNDPDDPTPDDPTTTAVTAIPVLEVAKSDTLLIDADGSGSASPGDTLLYNVTLVNSGNQAAIDVIYADIPDTNTTLVAGSVATDLGSATTGNTAGDVSVSINIGNLPGGAAAAISYRVTINNPLPAGVTSVSNQGIATSSDPRVPDTPTDDPATPDGDDPSETPVTAMPVLDATQSDTLLVDADGNGSPSPGDTLLYNITVMNRGNQAATDVVYGAILDANTTLLVGSVATDLGSVSIASAAGEPKVSVNIGTLPGGGTTVHISYQAIINNPLPAGVIQINNQGIVSSSDPRVPNVPTDDPHTLDGDDPTTTPVTLAPRMEATKRDGLLLDADGNGVPSPGDTIIYHITLDNRGNQAASGVLFADKLAANTRLVVGSVATDLGTVSVGNGAADSHVAVEVGTLPTARLVHISYQVTIDNPLPPNVNSVRNQGILSSDDPRVPDTPTDDPDTPDEEDPTETPVTALPQLDATKRDRLLVDADGNGVPSPGDTLVYNITIVNRGNQAATGLVYDDAPDMHTDLVAGSVATTLGTVSEGNSTMDARVEVAIGTLPGGNGKVTISYQVKIVNPLPAGVTQVSNQGVVSSDDPRVPNRPTDDPDFPTPDDPTRVPVTAAPLMEAFKRAQLLVDADSNGSPTAGDTLVYTIRLTNRGNQAAAGVIFDDQPDANTTLVIGSVAASAGSVSSGNTQGHTRVGVNVGTLPGGTSVTISYQARIKQPLPANVVLVNNQATVRGDNFPEVVTDDPVTVGTVPDDTEVVVVDKPFLRVTKHDSLLTDADENGAASAGDTLFYTVLIVNGGNAAAVNVVFNDTPDANTHLLVGSVRTGLGNVILGNGAQQTTVRVNIDQLPPGEQVEVSYQVEIDPKLPDEVKQVQNQGTVSSDNDISPCPVEAQISSGQGPDAVHCPQVVTNDPNTPAQHDPTITPLVPDDPTAEEPVEQPRDTRWLFLPRLNH